MIIAFGYKRESGKDTAAKMAVEYLRKSFVSSRRDSFARSLKEACKVIFNWTDEHVYGRLKSEVDDFWGFSPARALQLVGTECFRNNFCGDFWVRTIERRYLRYSPDVITLISDLRFSNEAEFVRRYGGYLVKVQRPVSRSSDGRSDDHVSEVALDSWDDWDAIIDNDSTLEDLRHTVESVIDSFRK